MRAPWSLSTLHLPFLVGRWPLERISHLSRRLLIQGRFDVEAIRCGQTWRLLTLGYLFAYDGGRGRPPAKCYSFNKKDAYEMNRKLFR